MGQTVVMGVSTPVIDDIVLRRPREAEASVPGSWASSAAETKRWCSSDDHPVSAERVLSWWETPDVEAYVAVDSAGALVGYGELWLDPDEDEVELARLIVSPTLRGQGVGRRLVAALVETARTTGLGTVILRVSRGNPAAVRCYRASGFRRLDAERNAAWNKGQSMPYIWMELVR
jgi:ribosomal protein S18 acetylase RimI-like enzyme